MNKHKKGEKVNGINFPNIYPPNLFLDNSNSHPNTNNKNHKTKNPTNNHHNNNIPTTTTVKTHSPINKIPTTTTTAIFTSI